MGGLGRLVGAARTNRGFVGGGQLQFGGNRDVAILAAFRPRIFFFCSVISGYSPSSLGIWKSTNASTSQRGVHIA